MKDLQAERLLLLVAGATEPFNSDGLRTPGDVLSQPQSLSNLASLVITFSQPSRKRLVVPEPLSTVMPQYPLCTQPPAVVLDSAPQALLPSLLATQRGSLPSSGCNTPSIMKMNPSLGEGSSLWVCPCALSALEGC